MPAPRVLEPVTDLSFLSNENLIIEGDNLQVMVSLRSQYRNCIDVAYLDPPYNTGRNDFRYSDKRFRDPNADSDDAVYVSSEDGGRHTKWLNFMGPRLHLAWDLLADSGVCFVSIDDTELFRLGLLMDEIFGERNRVGILVWKGATENNAQRIATGHEYILCYAKRIENLPSVWTGSSEAKDWLLATYERLRAKETSLARLDKAYKEAIREHVAEYERALARRGSTDLVDLGPLQRYRHVDSRGPYAAERRTHKPNEGYFYDVIHPTTGKPCRKPSSGYRFTPEKFKQILDDDRVIFGADHTQLWQLKVYLADIKPPLRGIIERDGRSGANVLKKLLPKAAEKFKHPKPVELMMQLIEFAADIDALVLDPFAGSGTTGHAVLRLNARDNGARRFITIEEGSHEDDFCRTLTAPRIRAAILKEELPGGFMFQQCGRKLDRAAILDRTRGQPQVRQATDPFPWPAPGGDRLREDADSRIRARRAWRRRRHLDEQVQRRHRADI